MKKKIIKFSVEAALIVISVLLALWIDNYKERGKEKDLKILLYHRLYNDIQKDSASFRGYLTRRKRAANDLETLLKYVNSKKITADSLAVFLGRLEYFSSYTSGNSTYNSIVSSGQLPLFEGDTVFLNVMRYCHSNADMVPTTGAYLAGANRFLVPYVNEHFDRRYFYDRTMAGKVDVSKFSDVAFVNICYSLMDRNLYEPFLLEHEARQHRLLKDIRTLLYKE